MRWVTQLRSLFLARSRREKILAAVFLVFLAAIWAGTQFTRWRAFTLRLQPELAIASSQSQWLENQEELEALYTETLAQLSDATLPPVRLVLEQIDALRPRYPFSFRLLPPQTQARDRLIFHTIEIPIENARYENLQTFQEELATILPTVNLEQITISADRRQPELLRASLRLVAVEFNR